MTPETFATEIKNGLSRFATGGGGHADYCVARCVFLRLLGAIYLFAFGSLWPQLDGLYGRNGILPIGDFLDQLRGRAIPSIHWYLPSVFWLDASDAALYFVCALGILFSLMLIAGLLQALSLIALFVLYLSFVSCGQDFLSFQWDALLLETGFIAIFLAPLRWFALPGDDPPPGRLTVWLHHWLLFRLMFSSGMIKLLSGDATWRNLTALNYHYMTQPLPPWTAWYMHQLPPWFQSLSAAFLLFVEIIAPFSIFMPRKFRLTGAALLILLQLLIIVTGNYCFFNYLAIALCLLLLDDNVWPERFRKKFAAGTGQAPGGLQRSSTGRLHLAVFIFILALSVPQQLLTLRLINPRASSFWGVYYALIETPRSFMIVNGYGLFANMTTTRPEIVIEGSLDGKDWREYEFRWKPGSLNRRPAFVAPYQPRLDWQLWFAALQAPGRRPWVNAFLDKLLHGQPEVLGLLGKNPFPDQPPKFIRAILYDYAFTDFASGKTGDWWTRRKIEIDQPPARL